jgi:arylsulfatase A-like enzyme
MASRFNLLWIVTTQWRAAACGFAGDPNARTPHLDALARESVNFVEAVTPHPFGPFARAALLTGIASPANGVRDYFDPLPAGMRTVAHDFRGRGHRTGFFGKWHLARRDPAAPLVGEAHALTMVPPEARGGFEFWEGFESGFLLNDPYLHGTRLSTPTRFSGYQSEIVCERAAAWCTERDQPWFAMVSLEAPHPPYDARSPVKPSSAEEIALAPNVPRGGESERRARAELAGYYAHIEATDAAIGRLLRALDHERTVLVFTSVHGDMHGAHGLFRKGWPHEESVRVPLLVRSPQARARRSAAAVSLLDLRALSRRWADGEWVEPERTWSVISMPSVVALPHQCDRVWSGVRSARRKLVWSGDGKPWLFFDLEADPWEQRNLVDDPSRAEERSRITAAVRGPDGVLPG